MHAITTRERRKFMPVDPITWTQPLPSHIFPSSFRGGEGGDKIQDELTTFLFPSCFFSKIVDRSISSAEAFVIRNPQVFLVSKCKAVFFCFRCVCLEKKREMKIRNPDLKRSPLGIEREREKPASHSLKLAASFFPDLCISISSFFYFLFCGRGKRVFTSPGADISPFPF